MNGQFDVSQLQVAAQILRTQVALFRASSLSAADVRVVLARSAECVSVANAFVNAASFRIEQTNAFVETGHRDAASFVASATNVTHAEAAKDLATARALESLHETQQAFDSGSISRTQVGFIAGSVDDPAAEAELLALAHSDSATVLAERARRLRKSSAEREAAEDARKKAARLCRVSTKRDDAMVSVFSLLEPHDGAEWQVELTARRDRIFREKRSRGSHDTFDHKMADAFMSILQDAKAHRSGTCATTRRTRKRRDALLLVDANALKRGYRESGEICELAGVGEISVSKATELLGEATYRVLVTDGVDIKTVTSKSRYWKAPVKAALEFRDRRCSVPGCDQQQWLQKDHRHRFSDGGPTDLRNGRQLCSHHHSLVTNKGFRLEGEPGNWRWIAPGQMDFVDSG